MQHYKCRVYHIISVVSPVIIITRTSSENFLNQNFVLNFSLHLIKFLDQIGLMVVDDILYYCEVVQMIEWLQWDYITFKKSYYHLLIFFDVCIKTSNAASDGNWSPEIVTYRTVTFPLPKCVRARVCLRACVCIRRHLKLLMI
jgi:hypothetical protein